MQSRSYYFLLIVLGLGLLFGFLYSRSEYQYGLDVKGGTRFTFKIKYDKDPKKAEQERAQLTTIVANVHRVLENRIIGPIGAAEGAVLDKGTDEFVVELPGITDPEKAEKIISTSASIKLYWARNLQTEKRSYRPYSYKDEKLALKDGSPYVNFYRGSQLIKLGDPEYQQVIDGWGEPILQGDELANAQPEQQAGGTYVPGLSFSSTGAQKMEEWSRRWKDDQEPLAFVLDNVVISIAPLAKGAIISDHAIIQGTFDVDYIKRFTSLLNSGALPVDLEKESSETVDPQIGNFALTQLETAGAVAFGLITLFLIAYYAFPGVVATVALVLYILFTLTTLKLIHATFSLAAIAGFILSVGMAVDANILVFERFKEEMRAGKSLKSAMELGFRRALPAIIDSNACTILTALVLANLGTGPVKNFATTLIIGVGISLFTAVSVTRSLLMFLGGSGIADKPNWYAVNRSWFSKLEARADHEPLRVVEKAWKWFAISGLTILLGVPFAFMGGFKLNVEFKGGVEAEYTLSDASITGNQIQRNLEAAGYKGSNVKFTKDQFGQRVASLTLLDAPDLRVSPDHPQYEVARKVAKAAGVDSIGVAEAKFALKDPNVTADQIQRSLDSAGYKGSSVIFTTDKGQRWANLILADSPDFAVDKVNTESVIAEKIAKAAGITDATPDTSKFTSENRTFSFVGPAIQQETLKNALLGIMLSSLLIVVYLAFRFGFAVGGFVPGARFGIAAIGALVHDVLVVIFLAAFVGYWMHWEISALFVTAMLTIIGFSVHDTIVIFDRIRENLRRSSIQEDFGHLVDRSITQSFTRSINTSMTVVATLAILVFFGTATVDLKFFCVAMLVGITSGTYSSIYNASPILYLWDQSILRKKGVEKTLVGLALAENAKSRVISTRPSGPTDRPSTPAAPTNVPTSPSTGRTYGQVKRRASQQGKGRIDLDE